jgi:DNA-binding SARP family transcriptional activator
MAVTFRALGEVAIEVDGDPLRLRPQERALLALLMCDTNRPVSAEVLMHQLWRGSPPASGRTALRVHVDRIRSTMRRHDLTRLVSGDHAYRLIVEPGEFDADEVARSVRWARTVATEQPALAATRLRAALDLWRGQPFPGIDDIEPIDSARRAYESSWVDLVGLLASVELGLGHHREIRSELLGWCEALPYSEELTTAAALAHYRCGDHVKALKVVREFTRRLDDELGLEPSADLRRLETAILNHSPILTAPPVTPERGVSVGRVRLPGFQAEADRLAGMLSYPPTGSGCIVVLGARGSGKSALLHHFSAGDDVRLVQHASSPDSGVAQLERELGLPAWSPSSATPGQTLPHLGRALEIAKACEAQRVRRLVVDDIALHGPDDLAVLRALVELEAPRPALLTSARSLGPDAHPLLADARALADSVTLELGDRDPAACRELLAELLPGLTSLDDDVIASLAHRSGGNPALLVALARDAAYGDATDRVPATVSEYVKRILDHLTPEQRELAYLAAIDTVPMLDMPTLSAVASQSVGADIDPMAAVEALVGEGLLIDAADGLGFRIHLVRDVVAASRSSVRRRTAHAMLARHLVEADARDVPRVAHHLRCAEAPELARLTAQFTAQEAATLAERGDGLNACAHFLYAAELAQRHTAGLAMALGWELDACAADVMLGRITAAQTRAASIASRARAGELPQLFVRAAIMATGPWRPIGKEQSIAAALTEEALGIDTAVVDGIDRVALLEACIRAHTGLDEGAFVESLGAIRAELTAAAAAGTPRARAIALRGLHSLAWRDRGTARSRGELSAQLVVWSALGDWNDLHLEALRLRTTDALEEGRPDVLARALDDYCSAAQASGSPLHLWWSATLKRTQAALSQDDDEAARAQVRAAAQAASVDPDLLAVAGLEQAFAAGLASGDLAALPGLLSGSDVHDVMSDPVVACGLLLVRAVLAGDVTEPEVESAWSRTVGTSREVAAAAFAALTLRHLPASADRDGVARRALSSLLPRSGGLVTVNGAAHFGPIDTYIGSLCAMLGEQAQADLHHAAANRLLQSFAHHPFPLPRESSWPS